MKIKLHQGENGEAQIEEVVEARDLPLDELLDFRDSAPDTSTAAGRRQRLRQLWLAHEEPREDAFRSFLRYGRDAVAEMEPTIRAQSVGTGSAGGYLAPQNFGDRIFSGMAGADALFGPDASTVVTTGSGTACPFPLADDSTGVAEIIAESGPFTISDIVFDQLALPKADTWRSNLVKCSLELVQDSGFDLEAFLEGAFAARFARGVGASLVATLAAGATSGVSAGASSITPANVFDLFGSINEAYLGAPKCAWAMRLSTFIAISKLINTSGGQVFPVTRDANGNFLLLTRPVRFCPSVAAIGTGNKSVFFGDLSYLVQRRVANSVSVRRLNEQYATSGEVGFCAYMRVSSGFAKASTADSPVKYLQHS